MPRHRFGSSAERGGGRVSPHCSIITRHTKLLSQVWRSVCRAGKRKTILPSSCVGHELYNYTHSPNAAFPPAQQNPPSACSREKLLWLCRAMPCALSTPSPRRAGVRRGWSLGMPELVWHLQRRLCGDRSLWDKSKGPISYKGPNLSRNFPLKADRQLLSGIYCCNYPPGTQLTSP